MLCYIIFGGLLHAPRMVDCDIDWRKPHQETTGIFLEWSWCPGSLKIKTCTHSFTISHRAWRQSSLRGTPPSRWAKSREEGSWQHFASSKSCFYGQKEQKKLTEVSYLGWSIVQTTDRLCVPWAHGVGERQDVWSCWRTPWAWFACGSCVIRNSAELVTMWQEGGIPPVTSFGG